MLRVGCRYSAVPPIYMSNDRLEPFNYHNIAFKTCADVVSLERLDRLWFFRHHWFVKIGWFGKCWTDLLPFWGVWNRSRILNFGPDRLFFRFSRALFLTSGLLELRARKYIRSCLLIRCLILLSIQSTLCFVLVIFIGMNSDFFRRASCVLYA